MKTRNKGRILNLSNFTNRKKRKSEPIPAYSVSYRSPKPELNVISEENPKIKKKPNSSPKRNNQKNKDFGKGKSQVLEMENKQIEDIKASVGGVARVKSDPKSVSKMAKQMKSAKQSVAKPSPGKRKTDKVVLKPKKRNSSKEVIEPKQVEKVSEEESKKPVNIHIVNIETNKGEKAKLAEENPYIDQSSKEAKKPAKRDSGSLQEHTDIIASTHESKPEQKEAKNLVREASRLHTISEARQETVTEDDVNKHLVENSQDDQIKNQEKETENKVYAILGNFILNFPYF